MDIFEVTILVLISISIGAGLFLTGILLYRYVSALESIAESFRWMSGEYTEDEDEPEVKPK